MTWVYVVAPVAGYLAAGCLKFAVNCLRERRLAFDLIGLGGMPSTHTTITSTVAAMIGCRDGFGTPAFSVAAALVLIVAIDAMDLRRKVGQQASVIKRLAPTMPEALVLRERVGHRQIEVLAGAALGMIIGAGLSLF